MFEFIKAGGWLMFPIVLSSILALAIIIERFLALKVSKVVPKGDIERARKMAAAGKVNATAVEDLRSRSLVGRVLAVGLESRDLPRHIMKENLEEAGRHAVHSMERYLTALGTIAAITPLMGLLGTVLGMIQTFSAITRVGVGNPTELAGGISQALITTAAGISIAIIALIFHRYFKARVGGFVVEMEQEAVRLVEIANEKRKTPAAPRPNTAPAQKKPANAAAAAAARAAAIKANPAAAAAAARAAAARRGEKTA